MLRQTVSITMSQNNIVHIPYGTGAARRLSLPARTRQLQVEEPQKMITPAPFQRKTGHFFTAKSS